MNSREPTVEGLWPELRAMHGHLVLDEREFVAAFELRSGLNPVTADSKDYERAVKRFQDALEDLRPGERVQLLVDCSRYNPEADLERMRNQVSDESPQGHRGYYAPSMETHLRGYCALSFVPEFNYHLLFSCPSRREARPTNPGQLREALDQVRLRSGEFARHLSGGDLVCKPLDEKGVQELLDRTLNPSRLAPLPGGVLSSGGATGLEEGGGPLFRSPVLLKVGEGDPRYSCIQVGRRLVRTMGFLRAPLGDEALRVAMAELMLCGRSFRFSIFVEGISQERAAQVVQKKRAAALGAVTFGEGKATQASEEQAAEYDALLRAHARRELKFVRWSAYLSVSADNRPELDQASGELGGLLNALVPDEGILRQLEYWQATQPLCRDTGGNPLLARSDAVASLYPFFEFRSTSPEGGALLGFSPANQPCFYDPWSRVVSNGNVFVTGQAGSGKSFLINLVVNRLGMRALDVSFIDRAKSYRSTCMALEGDYIEFDLNGSQAVNVWDVLEYDPAFDEAGLNDLDRSGRVLPEKLEQVAGCLEIVLADGGADLPKLERSLLLEDIAETYRRRLRFSGGVLAQASVPCFGDLAETIATRVSSGGDFAAERKEMLQKLRPVVGGHLAGLLNRPTTLTAGSRARVFDISNLPENSTVLGAAVYVLAAWLYRHWRRNKAMERRQIVVFDEIHSFMGFESGRRLLDALARRSRHMGLMPFFATQQLSDVLDYKETRSILDNCQTQFLFAQARNVIDRVTDLLKLTDHERVHLENLRQVRGVYSTAFFVYGSQRNIITVRPDPVTRWLNTTEPTHDLPRLNRALRDAGGDIWAAVRALAQADAQTA